MKLFLFLALLGLVSLSAQATFVKVEECKGKSLQGEDLTVAAFHEKGMSQGILFMVIGEHKDAHHAMSFSEVSTEDANGHLHFLNNTFGLDFILDGGETLIEWVYLDGKIVGRELICFQRAAI